MRHFRTGVRGSALWGKGSSGTRLRAFVATLFAIAALAAPSTALADDAMDAFLADVYADTTVDLTTDASGDVSWSDVSWDDVSWSDSVSWSD